MVLGHPTGYGKDSKEFSILRYAKGSPRRESFTGKLKGKQTERKADKKEIKQMERTEVHTKILNKAKRPKRSKTQSGGGYNDPTTEISQKRGSATGRRFRIMKKI